MHTNLTVFGRVVFELCERTDKTDKLTKATDHPTRATATVGVDN